MSFKTSQRSGTSANLSVAKVLPEAATASIASNWPAAPASQNVVCALTSPIHLAIDAIEIADLVGIEITPIDSPPDAG